MKNTYFFTLLSIILMCGISFAQVPVIDFETVGNDWTYGLFGQGTGSTFSIVANPDPSGINTSDSVACFIVGADAEGWAGVFSGDFPDLILDATNAIVTVMVWKDVISDVNLKLEAPNIDQRGIQNTVTGQWEEVKFDYSAYIGDTVITLTMLPDHVDTRTAGSINYWDNITFGPVTQDSVDVTFQIDMSVEIAMGRFDPMTEVVTVPGGFNEWLNEPPANSTKTMDDSDNDSVYTKTIKVGSNATYEYKYNIGLGWDGKDENFGGPNRSVDIADADTTLDPSFFNVLASYSGIPTNVEFSVDMSLPAQAGFDPTTDHVYVAGNFTGTTWSDGAVEMEDLDNDTTYTVALDTLVSGELLIYKFIWSTSDAASGTWESNPEGGDDIIPESGGNRIFGPVDGTNVIDRFWNNLDPNIELADGNILFEIDMSVMSEVGIYDNVNDTLKLMGAFNGWNVNDPDAIMDQDPIVPDLYFLQESFVQQVLGETQQHKFLVNKADTNDLWTDGYERPLSVGGGNRKVDFLGEPDQQAGFTYYDNVSPEWVIESGVNLEMVFSVDMRAAMDPVLQGLPFDPAADSLYWINEQPTFTRTQGWKDEDEMRVLLLTDTDGDSIFSGTLAPLTPTFNAFEYRYAFIDVSEGDNVWTFEPTGLGTDDVYRVRFIGQDAPRSFPFTTWNAPTDTWTNANVKTDQEIDPYETLVGVDDESDLYLNQYALEQNYPNPFNPATIIRFSIPQAQFVTLYVYNILGERVATLVNREMTAGVHHINFNASNLPSGVYIYSISAGEYYSTKKMILLK